MTRILNYAQPDTDIYRLNAQLVFLLLNKEEEEEEKENGK